MGIGVVIPRYPFLSPCCASVCYEDQSWIGHIVAVCKSCGGKGLMRDWEEVYVSHVGKRR